MCGQPLGLFGEGDGLVSTGRTSRRGRSPGRSATRSPGRSRTARPGGSRWWSVLATSGGGHQHASLTGGGGRAGSGPAARLAAAAAQVGSHPACGRRGSAARPADRAAAEQATRRLMPHHRLGRPVAALDRLSWPGAGLVAGQADGRPAARADRPSPRAGQPGSRVPSRAEDLPEGDRGVHRPLGQDLLVAGRVARLWPGRGMSIAVRTALSRSRTSGDSGVLMRPSPASGQKAASRRRRTGRRAARSADR